MAYNQAFAPSFGTGVVTTTSTVSASLTVAKGTKAVAITNLGATTVYAKVGSVAITATAADYPILPACHAVISKDIYDTIIAVVSPDGSGSVHTILGEGV
jgi:hypothetical protein